MPPQIPIISTHFVNCFLSFDQILIAFSPYTPMISLSARSILEDLVFEHLTFNSFRTLNIYRDSAKIIFEINTLLYTLPIIPSNQPPET